MLSPLFSWNIQGIFLDMDNMKAGTSVSFFSLKTLSVTTNICVECLKQTEDRCVMLVSKLCITVLGTQH